MLGTNPLVSMSDSRLGANCKFIISVPFCDANAGAFHFTHGEAKPFSKAAQVQSGRKDGDFTFRSLHQECSRIRCDSPLFQRLSGG